MTPWRKLSLQVVLIRTCPRLFSFLEVSKEILTASGTWEQLPGISQTKLESPEGTANPGEPSACIES